MADASGERALAHGAVVSAARLGPGLVMDVADMDTVMAAMETQPAADAMAHDGVLPETLVILVEA
jgi:hypothetical protein